MTTPFAGSGCRSIGKRSSWNISRRSCFVDEQVKGPYSLWRHTHTFQQTENGVVVGDRVDYALPFGPRGQLTHSMIIRGQVEEIFRFRQQELGKMLGGKTKQTVRPFITG